MAISLFLLAILSTQLMPKRMTSVLFGCIATLLTMSAVLWHTEVALSTLLKEHIVISIVIYWVSVTLIYLDPRWNAASIDEWQDTFESAPAGMAMIDLKGKIVRANASFANIDPEISLLHSASSVTHSLGR